MMTETPKTIEIEDLITHSNNLIKFLKEENKDIANLNLFLNHSKTFQSQCHQDFYDLTNSIQEYERKVDACKEKAAAAECESVSNADIDLLQKALVDEENVEYMLREELRVIVDEMVDLERQRDFIEEQMLLIKKLEQDEQRAQMKLSMNASVTNVIPYLDDTSKISGHIVEPNRKEIEKFEFDISDTTTFDTCNNIWKNMKS